MGDNFGVPDLAVFDRDRPPFFTVNGWLESGSRNGSFDSSVEFHD
jgi:hypothetical protein